MEYIVLIPTGFKSKIPHTLSYPIGAEAISRALKGVPQFDKLALDFWFYSKVRPDFSRIYAVFEIAYSRPVKTIFSQKDALESGRFERCWQLKVRPVARERRHLIKTLLQEEALPLTRKWLMENCDRDEIGGTSMIFSFDEETELLSTQVTSHLSPRQSR